MKPKFVSLHQRIFLLRQIVKWYKWDKGERSFYKFASISRSMIKLSRLSRKSIINITVALSASLPVIPTALRSARILWSLTLKQHETSATCGQVREISIRYSGTWGMHPIKATNETLTVAACKLFWFAFPSLNVRVTAQWWKQTLNIYRKCQSLMKKVDASVNDK
jgi:hypothetical protein